MVLYTSSFPRSRESTWNGSLYLVIPAQAGIQKSAAPVVISLDSRLRGNDG
jgi:hypothetical protein